MITIRCDLQDKIDALSPDIKECWENVLSAACLILPPEVSAAKAYANLLAITFYNAYRLGVLDGRIQAHGKFTYGDNDVIKIEG